MGLFLLYVEWKVKMNNDKLLNLTKKYINLQKLSLDNTSEECTLAKQKAEVILEEIKTLSSSLHTHLVSVSSETK